MACGSRRVALTLTPVPLKPRRHRPARSRSTYRPAAAVIRRLLQNQLDQDRAAVQAEVARHFPGASTARKPPQHDGVDLAAVNRLSTVIRQRDLTLVETVQLLRGESEADPRPNKALDPRRLSWLLEGYEHRDLLVRTAKSGFKATWKQPAASQQTLPSNHKSAQSHRQALLRSIRRGQDAGEYLVVDLEVFRRWGIRSSPFGAVEKSGIDPALEIRLIHDLSYPHGISTNDLTESGSLPVILYKHVSAIAERIEAEHAYIIQRGLHNTCVLLLKGDVRGAFRHLHHAAGDVGWMGACFPDLGVGVIDLAAPFGWTGSPAFYGVFGRAISFLVGRESPATMCEGSTDDRPFFPYEWVDDHLLVEVDEGDRCTIAEDVLRLAMLAVLGPESINDKKFSSWSHELTALGLLWNTRDRTVSMPAAKIAKALERVKAISRQPSASRTEVLQLLGSLRHVCSCLRSAKPFYQHIVDFSCGLPRYGRRPIPQAVRDDLEWFSIILTEGCLASIPTRLFCKHPPVDIHLYMDASDFGLAVLDLRSRRFIRIEFDDTEREQICRQGDEFPINVREQFCIALACAVFGPSWSLGFMPHVRCWSDNTSAVAWTNRLYSPSPAGQTLNRVIGLTEAHYGFRVSAAHLQGSCNIMADAGSRYNCAASRLTFDSLSQGWHQVTVPAPLRHMYRTCFSVCSQNLWPRAPGSSTGAHGSNGAAGAPAIVTQNSSPKGVKNTPSDSSALPSSVGTALGSVDQSQQPPSCPSYATSLGIISHYTGIEWACTKVTNSPCGACRGSATEAIENDRSTDKSCSQCASSSTSAMPGTASRGGLRSWVSSF